MSQKTFILAMTVVLAINLGLIMVACSIKKEPKVPYKEPETTVKLEAVTKPSEVIVETKLSEEETTNGNHVDIVADSEPITTGDDNLTTGIYKSIEDLANEVLDLGINGEERANYLSERYEEVQAYIDSHYEVPTYVYDDTTYVYQPDTGAYYSDNTLNPEAGVNYYNGIRETYYNMDMSEWLDFIYSLGYSGEYWVRSDGVKMFGDYIIVAADYSQFPRGTIVETSLGTGMVLDTGLGGWNWFDIAVNW